MCVWLRCAPAKLLQPLEFKLRHLREGVVHGECVGIIPMLSIDSVPVNNKETQTEVSQRQRDLVLSSVAPAAGLFAGSSQWRAADGA